MELFTGFFRFKLLWNVDTYVGGGRGKKRGKWYNGRGGSVSLTVFGGGRLFGPLEKSSPFKNGA